MISAVGGELLALCFVAVSHAECPNQEVTKPRTLSISPPNFPRAFRTARVAKGIPQEAFDLVSSRTYVSLVERGINSPTLSKIDELVRVLGVHPLTVLALSYAKTPTSAGVAGLLERIATEIEALDVSEFAVGTLPRGVKKREAQ